MKPDYAVQIIWSKEDEAYIASTLELPGCMADGATPEEALANLRVVISEWVEVAKEEGRKIPQPMSCEDFARVAETAEKNFRAQLEREVAAIVNGLIQQLGAPAQQHGSYFRVIGLSHPELKPAGSDR
jgi:predicted RNase H-like HicB family nuclease